MRHSMKRVWLHLQLWGLIAFLLVLMLFDKLDKLDIGEDR